MVFNGVRLFNTMIKKHVMLTYISINGVRLFNTMTKKTCNVNLYIYQWCFDLTGAVYA